MSEGLPPIERPYLLIVPIPHFLHDDGSIWLERLWHHDLIEHLSYLRRLTLLSPRRPWSAILDLVRVDPPTGAEFTVVAIPPLDSVSQALRRLPRLAGILWRTIGRVDIVHSGIAGWPVAIGWIANPIALVRGKKLVIVVESAFWRVPIGQRGSLKARIRASATEFLARFFVNRADLLFVTQPAYRTSLLTSGRAKAYTTPATWINDEDILSDREAELCWERKLRAPAGEARVLFAGQLVPGKGIDVLLAALRRLDEQGAKLRVDVIGEGPRRPECAATERDLKTVKMSVLTPVPYGGEFFELLRSYHAIVVPSLSDEQPRVVFDAFSQAVPVLAAKTDGLVSHVVEGRTGRLFEPGDTESLATALRDASDTAALQRMGMRALEAARGLTHREMHRTRWRILVNQFGASRGTDGT